MGHLRRCTGGCFHFFSQERHYEKKIIKILVNAFAVLFMHSLFMLLIC